MKLLRSLRAYLGRKVPVQSEPVVVAPSEIQALSPVQHNLSWLPTHEESKPFSTPLPGCPRLWPEDNELRNRYLAYVTHAQEVGPLALTEPCCEEGHKLAQQLHSRAIDLSCAKATEQCAEIYWYLQCAALVSLVADGAESKDFIRFTKDVHHYKNGRMTAGQVWAFDLYVEVFTSKLQSGNVLLMRDASTARPPGEPVPQPAEMDELLSYLPQLYPNGIAIKTYTVPEGTHWSRYFDVVDDFYKAVAKDCWNDFDYLSNGAALMLENEPYIAHASFADLQTMLTYCIRGEFCDGHHGSMIEKGHVLNMLRRLEILRSERGA
ncbi:DUF6508 domain-containing protein [Pseudomonas sp. LP_7_YM]|uniref:DUF6508 domain-containing protein n=1 Tax=Pseudomonas sp. LP_7_YM TaxID=2485137 RepID=UPI00105D3411|nr:DUF6508 domain-containing protein [Pseudomonas sp. LP_7_YM]TDV59175.1 hypothetical protein EC915_11943 [Pseudomonas sp. LP_7_YM]